MSIPFLDDPNKAQELKTSLGRALDDQAQKYKAVVMYAAHLNAMLREACEILENLEVTVDVSEPLAFWWEKEKRKKASNEGTDTGLVSADGTAIRRGVGPDRGSAVDSFEPIAGESDVDEVLPNS